MTPTKALGIASLVFIALASVHASAQPGASEAGAASRAAASGGSTAKDSKTNRTLRRAVYAAIVKHKEINAGDISVVAKNGAVTLDGTVMDASQIDKVAQIARGVPGVTSVTNKLTVQKPFGGQ
jgi:hyperosmotically inducible periplasmic protein